MMGRLALSFLVEADEEAPPCEPFRHVLGIEFRGKEIEGWYYIENDGVSVFYRSRPACSAVAGPTSNLASSLSWLA